MFRCCTFYNSASPGWLRIKDRNYKNNWITSGIKTSRKHKRELFLLIRNDNNPAMKHYYKKYCKILTQVIKEARRMTLSKRILKSNNKSKTTQNVINELLSKQRPSQDIREIIIRKEHLRNQHNIAEAFNKYSSTIDLNNINGKKRKCSLTHLHIEIQTKEQVIFLFLLL